MSEGLFSIIPTQLLERDAAHLIRQSTKLQAERNIGSAALQMQEAQFAINCGWPKERVILHDLRGESGSRGRQRPKFATLLQEVRDGLYGIVVVGRADRLGRNDVDSAEFLQACADTHTMIGVGGRLYNPASIGDHMMLGVMSKFAEYENQGRIRWMVASRWSLAKRLGFRICLPTGLTWADPRDPTYVEAINRAGLKDWADRLDEHRVKSSYRGEEHYILPFPDRQVFDAVRLSIKWVRETGDLHEVVDRIRSGDSGWPRPGAVPALRSFRFSASQQPSWHTDHDVVLYTRLKELLLRPSLYGVYTYKSPAMAKRELDVAANEYEVWEENVFPSLGQLEDYRDIKKILAQRSRQAWKRGEYNGPRRHALEGLVCAEANVNGSPCGKKLHAMYQSDGTWGYWGHSCDQRGHAVPSVQHDIDSQVIEIVLGVLEQSRIRSAIGQVRLHATSSTQHRRALETVLEKKAKEADAIAKLEIQAQIDDDAESRIRWRKERKRVEQEQRDVQRQVSVLHADEEAMRQITDADIQQILDLAADLPSLVHRAREANPGFLRQLIRGLVASVRFQRRDSFSYEIEVVFPEGGSIKKTVYSRNFNATQAAMAWANGRLLEGADDEVVAQELNFPPATKHRVTWTAERVRVAADLFERDCLAETREGRGTLLSELVVRYDVKKKEVRRAAFTGQLGPAAFEKGDLRVWPTPAELHLGLPEAARHDVAHAAGWPVSDTVSLAEVARVVGKTRGAVTRQARESSGVRKDARGRDYGRRSELIVDIAKAIRDELAKRAPRHLELDPEGWIPLPEAKELFPRMTLKTFLKQFPTVRPGVGHAGSRSVFVWVGPDFSVPGEQRD